MLYKITKIISIEPYTVTCVFNTGEIREIDFTDWVNEFKQLHNDWTSRLADPEFFITAKLADYGTIAWGEDIDFDPAVLYLKGRLAVNQSTGIGQQ